MSRDDLRSLYLWEEPGLTARERLSALAGSFPTLKKFVAPIEPFDPTALDKWAVTHCPGGADGTNASHAVRFMLSIFNARARWRSGRFDLHVALREWDPEHRVAFVVWTKNPWWP